MDNEGSNYDFRSKLVFDGSVIHTTFSISSVIQQMSRV